MVGISTLGQVLDQIDRLKTQQSLFGTLSVQLTTGKKTQEFSGLGTSVLTSERARADFKMMDGYIKNIVNADRRMKLMLGAIEEIKAQTENFSHALSTFSIESAHQQGDPVYFDDPSTTAVIETTQVGFTSSSPDVDFQALKDLANNIFNYIVDLMNTQETDRFVFGGAESLSQPLDMSGTLETAVGTLLHGWKNGTVTTDELIADFNDRTASVSNPNAITDTIIGYNSQVAGGNTGKVFARVSDQSEIDYTVLANEDPFRDILVTLSYFKSAELGPIVDEVEIDDLTGLPVVINEGSPGADVGEMMDNFYEVFNNMAIKINRAIDNVDQLRFKVEGARARIDDIKKGHENQRNLLLNTVSQVEDVDINEVALKISALQTQLEASYRVTAIIRELTLVNYMSPF